MTLYIPSGIGGGYDTYGRLASRHLGRFLPGNPTIVPKNMPGAGGVVLANYLYNVAPKDGSAIALLQGGTPLEPLFGFSQAKYDVTQFNWLISLNRLVSIGVFWHTSPVAHRRDLFKRDVLVGSSGGGDSSTEILPRLLNRFAGTRFKIVSGYKGTGDGMLAMERGEVEGIVGHELSSAARRPAGLAARQQGADRDPGRADPFARPPGRAERARSGQGRGAPQGLRAAADAAGATAGRSWRRPGRRRTSSRR